MTTKIQHTMNGDEQNGWYCYGCSFFTRDVSKAAEHDGRWENIETKMPCQQCEALKSAANKLIDYCEDHDWGTMPEPFDAINPLLALLDRPLKSRDLYVLRRENADLRRQLQEAVNLAVELQIRLTKAAIPEVKE